MSMITSLQNPMVKAMLALHESKGRKEAKAFLIEGLRFVEEAVEAQAPISEVVYVDNLSSEDRGARLLKHLQEMGVKLTLVDDRVLRSVAQTKTPQGVVAKIKQSSTRPDQIWSPKARLVVVDRVQDPGNLGTIIRTAAANGMDGIYLLQGTVDLYNDKVLRSTMGTLFSIPICSDASIDEILSVCQQSSLQLTVAMMDGVKLPYEADLAAGVAIVVGNEGAGVCSSLIDIAHQTIRIPMLGQAESLNVAVAAGILMYESTRQQLISAGIH